MGGESLKQSTEVLHVLRGRVAGNQQVVQVCEAEWEAGHHLIDKSLERLAGITQPEWHPYELEQPERSCNGGLGNVIRIYWYLMIRPDKVDF